MRLALASSSSRFRVRPLTVVIYVVGAVLAYQCAQYLINGNFVGLAYAGIVCVGAVIVIGILKNWRNGVYFFLSWLLFEDFIRKSLGNNMAIYFAKDFLALVVLISFVAAQRQIRERNFRPPFRVALWIFVWFGAIQVFNPASTSIWFGLMGFKIFFYYVPLLFVGYALLNSEEEFRRFFKVNIGLALVIMSLGIAQSILGQGFLNPSQPADDLRELSTLYRVSPLTGAIAYRPTSVFVSTSRYANFINVASLLVFGFGGYLLLRQKKGRVLVFIAIAAAATAGFLTASRGTFLWTIINLIATSVAFIWGAPWKQGEALRVLRAVQRAALAVALGIVLLFITYPESLLSRLAIYQETLSPSSTGNELTHRTWSYPIRNFLGAFDYERWFWGYGIGTTALGGQYVARFFRVKPPVGGVESGYGTLVVEMGIGGLILWIAVSSAICISAWRVVKSLKGSPWFPVGFVLFWYSFVLLFPSTFAGIQSYEDYLLNAYLWLGLGLLFRLPTIALSSHSETAARAGQIQAHWIR
jgi:hypothetical protein